MLVLKRREGERIVIYSDKNPEDRLVIKVLDVSISKNEYGERVKSCRLAFDAKDDLRVDREEVYNTRTGIEIPPPEFKGIKGVRRPRFNMGE